MREHKPLNMSQVAFQPKEAYHLFEERPGRCEGMSGSQRFIDDQPPGEPLLESEGHYQAMAEAATDAIITINSESTILLVNPAAEKIFGYSIDEMLGQPLTMLMPEYLRHLHRAGVARYLGTGQKHIDWAAVRLPGLHKSGKEIPLEISFVEFSKGRQRFFTGIVRDVTERERAEETQIRFARDASLRAEVCAAFNQTGSLGALLQTCAEAVVRNLDAAFARIWTLNDDQNMLELQASAGLYTHLDGAHSRIPIGSYKIGMLAAERKPHLTNSVQEDERVSDKEWARREGMVSFAGYPLMVEKQLVGVVAMFARHVLEQDIIEALETIVPVISLGIERKNIEDQLLLAKYSIDHVAQSVIRVDAEARIVFVNEACCRNLGYTREELLELRIFDINPYFPEEVWADHWNNLRTLKSMSMESAHRRNDGHIFPIELSLNYLLYEGNEYSFAIARDITERKKREEALQLLSTRLLQLQDEERRRIARDLHDVTAQDLGAVVVNLAHLRRVATDLKPEAQSIVSESVALAEQVLQQIRTLSYLLHPPMLDEIGLASALRWYIEGFTKRSGISVDLEVDTEIGRLSLETETALFRIMQESLTNIHRHSGSGGATIRLVRNKESVALYVKDQGSGMLEGADAEAVDSVQSLGLGILGMRQRLRQFGGKLEIETSKRGTEIRAIVPIAARTAGDGV
jgi:PAS domain S-box-containing protein